MRVWKVGKELNKEAMEIAKSHYEWSDRMEAFRVQMGAEAVFFDASFGQYTLRSASFPDTPDKSLWVKTRQRGVYRPRICPRNADLLDRMRAISTDAPKRMMDLLGITKKGQVVLFDIGIAVHGQGVYISTPDSIESVKGCKRISDVQYEKIRGE